MFWWTFQLLKIFCHFQEPERIVHNGRSSRLVAFTWFFGLGEFGGQGWDLPCQYSVLVLSFTGEPQWFHIHAWLADMVWGNGHGWGFFKFSFKLGCSVSFCDLGPRRDRWRFVGAPKLNISFLLLRPHPERPFSFSYLLRMPEVLSLPPLHFYFWLLNTAAEIEQLKHLPKK